jgi:hypothetical protein
MGAFPVGDRAEAKGYQFFATPITESVTPSPIVNNISGRTIVKENVDQPVNRHPMPISAAVSAALPLSMVLSGTTMNRPEERLIFSTARA